MKKDEAFKKIRFKVNPYLCELLKCKRIFVGKTITSKALADGKELYDPKTDEQVKLYVNVKEKCSSEDHREFTKVFDESLSNVRDLSLIERKMLDFIFLSLRFKDEDEFYLDVEEAMKWNKYKTMSTVYQAINGLIENGFIARNYKRGFYFINPMYFYKGEIVKKYESLVENMEDYNRQLREDYNSIEEKINQNIHETV